MINEDEKRLEHIIRRMQRDDSTDAPADTRQYVKNLFAARAVPQNISPIRRLVAAITMELSPDRAVFGERSGSASAQRQMLFTAGESAINLRIEAAGKKFDIRGQVLGEGFVDVRAILEGSGTSLVSVLDEIAGFRFYGVNAGVYRLTIRSDSDEVVIETLELQ